MSQSEILGPIDYLSDIGNRLKGLCLEITVLSKKNIPIIYVNTTTLKCMPEASQTVYMTNIRAIPFYQDCCC